MVMRRLVTQGGMRKLSEIGVTSQVPEAKLGLHQGQTLRSKTPMFPLYYEGVFVLERYPKDLNP